MARANWKIKFSWVKAHVGIYGNEMADRLAKEAARNDENSEEYNRIPISAIYRETAEKLLLKWQEQWLNTPKAEATKQYFPTVKDRKVKKNPPHSKVNCGPYRSRENECVSTQVPSTGRCEMHM
jgi:hypothetical protein